MHRTGVEEVEEEEEEGKGKEGGFPKRKIKNIFIYPYIYKLNNKYKKRNSNTIVYNTVLSLQAIVNVLKIKIQIVSTRVKG